jgi:hypothetical protein
VDEYCQVERRRSWTGIKICVSIQLRALFPPGRQEHRLSLPFKFVINRNPVCKDMSVKESRRELNACGGPRISSKNLKGKFALMLVEE